MLGRRKKPIDLSERLDALRAAIELADGRLDPDAVAFARNVVDKADGRLRHGTSHTLVALLGATGAGKSSITNALVGDDVATTGVRRPTTSATLACIWGSQPQAETGALLDWLEIEHRHLVGGEAGSELDGLVLLDVPDHDSVEMSHRLEMERIAEHCDLMIWVTDPEKYADKALHHYLRSLPRHSAVVVLVLNKVDQLTDDEVDACRIDLTRLATADGLVEPTVLPVSAASGVGISDLRAAVGQAIDDRAAMTERLVADVAAAGTELAESIGGGEASVRDRAVTTLADELVDATGIDAVTDAVAAGTRRDAAAAMGWPFTRWIRRLRPHPLGRLHLGAGSSGRSSLPTASAAQTARAEGAVRTFVDDVSRDLAHPWPGVLRSAGTPDQAVLADRLDRAVADGVREHAGNTPRWWSAVGALQILFAIAAAAGAAWLTVLFALAWLQVPDPPTPEWRGWPVPTLLFGVGVLLGLLVAAIAGRIAGLSARRAARRARAAAIEKVERVANELVVDPVRRELAGRSELLEALATTRT